MKMQNEKAKKLLKYNNSKELNLKEDKDSNMPKIQFTLFNITLQNKDISQVNKRIFF
jgi:hypothetical protein